MKISWPFSTRGIACLSLGLVGLFTVGAPAPGVAYTEVATPEATVSTPETEHAGRYFYPGGPCYNMPDLVPKISKVRYKGKLNKKVGLWVYKVNARVEVTNFGSACAMQKSTVRLYLSEDPYLDPSDILITGKQMKKLCPPKKPHKAPKPKKMSLKAKLPPGINPYGMYLLAVADADNVIFECDETNNVAVGVY